MSEPALAIAALACRRGDRLLWRGLSVEVEAGGALHVVGANGVGKSSLLRILAGLLPAASGSVRCAVRRGLVDEAHALEPTLPLRDALAFWARIDGGDAGAVHAALDRMEMAALAPVPVRILSTGQRKRAALARLLAGGARLWLLDEPANGLDRAGVALLETLVAEHRAGGGLVVAASHQPLALPAAATLDFAQYAL